MTQAVDALLGEMEDKHDPQKIKAKQPAMEMGEEKDDLDDMLNQLKN